MKQDVGRPTGEYWRRPEIDATSAGASAAWVRHGRGGAAAGVGAVLEVALPLTDLGAAPNARLAFFVAVYDPLSTERERHPEHRPIEMTVPDGAFEARHWSA